MYHLFPAALLRISCKILCVMVLGMGGVSTSRAAEPATDAALALQQSAQARVDQSITRMRQTGEGRTVFAELQKAHEEFQRSAALFLQRREVAAAALSQHKSADCLRLQRRWPEAEALYREALQLAQQARHPAYQAKSLLGLARVAAYRTPADVEKAFQSIETALRLGDAAIDAPDLFDLYDLKSDILGRRGENVAAFDATLRAFAIGGNSPDPVLRYFAYFSRGDSYQSIGENCDRQRSLAACQDALRRAISDYREALTLAQSQQYDFYVATLKGLIEGVETRQTMWRQNLNLFSANEKAFNPLVPQDVIVGEYFHPGTLPPLYEKALEEDVKNMPRYDPGYYQNQAMLLMSKGQNEAALKSYQEGIERIEADRRQFDDASARERYFADKLSFFYDPASLLLHLRRPAEAFSLIERSRSRAMAELLQTQTLQFGQSADTQLYAETIKLDTQIARLQQQLFTKRFEDTAADATAQEAALRRLENERRALIAAASGRGARLSEILTPPPVTLSAVQQALRENHSEALYYLLRDTDLLLWHISGTAVNVRTVLLPREFLAQKIATLRRSLTTDKTAFNEKLARELFLFLIQPALPWIKSDRLVIFPHEDLHYLPFQALMAPNGEALGERFALSYAPSADVWMRLKPVANLGGARLFAAGTPQFAGEIAALGKLYPNRARLISQPSIAKSELKSGLAGYDLIHLALHGKFSAQDPLLSHLELARPARDDARLTAAEMFGLPLQNVRLVTLGACETGQAQATRANEVIGMQRALLYAGAQNLLLTAWEVNSAATQLWMETFYRAAQTQSPAYAARAALIAVKRDPRYAHPAFWSPFLLIGR